MNILMMSGDTSVVEGKQGAFYNTLEEFSKYWDKVDIIVPPLASISRHESFRNVTFYPSPWPKLMQPLFIWSKGLVLASERKYDLIVSHDYGLFLNGRGASRLVRKLGVPHVSEIHHVDGHPRPATIRDRITLWMTRNYVRKMRSSVAGFRITNEVELMPLLVRWGVPDEKIMLLYSLYLDFKVFRPQPTQHEFDAIFCGRLVPNKGLGLFLEGLAHAVKKIHNLRVLVIGQGPLAASLSRRTVDLGLAANVEFRDWIDTPNELADLYRRSRCLICTSLAEGGPRVVAEALACGVPVITTRVGLAGDLVQNGVNGFHIDWSAKDMADRLFQINSDRELRCRLGKSAPDAVRRFEKSRVIGEYAAAYQKLASR